MAVVRRPVGGSGTEQGSGRVRHDFGVLRGLGWGGEEGGVGVKAMGKEGAKSSVVVM